MNNVGQVILPLSLLLFIVSPVLATEESWLERVDFNGDFRLRYEGIDEEFVADRRRIRFRARFGFSAALGDSVSVVMQLASGGDNPVSTNQTFDEGFTGKDISLDLAYVDWKINDNLRLNAGKMKNPQYRAGNAPLIWDSDLNPEGIALKISKGGFSGSLAGYSVEERSSSDDSLLYTVQAVYKWPLAERVTMTAGGGLFAYTNTIGNAPFFNGDAQGNTVDAAENYVFDYKNIELFTELATKVEGWPLALFVHTTRNTQVSQQDTAYAVGARIGSAKEVGDIEFGWTYQDIEADAVIGTFNDSDFGGGGADSEGHLLKARYAFRKKVLFAGTLYLTEVNRFQATRHDYNRIQIDVELKFN